MTVLLSSTVVSMIEAGTTKQHTSALAADLVALLRGCVPDAVTPSGFTVNRAVRESVPERTATPRAVRTGSSS